MNNQTQKSEIPAMATHSNDDARMITIVEGDCIRPDKHSFENVLVTTISKTHIMYRCKCGMVDADAYVLAKYLKQFFFTFGAKHFDSKGATLGNCYTSIFAPDWEIARKIMFVLRGNFWAFQYGTEGEAGVARYKMTYIPFYLL